ncbi:hypothetical protein MTO96_032565 [Rhipicephalus appendiculatus]
MEREHYGVAFLKGLRRNRTITTLSFDIRLFGTLPYEYRLSRRSAAVFSGYLRDNKTLHTLILRGGRHREHFTEVSRPIVEALISNDTLTKLSLESLLLEDKDIEHVTWLLSQNRTLTSFKMIRCDTRYASNRANSYLAALKENMTLEELVLELPPINPTESRSLFEALASKQSLKKVIVKQFSDYDVADICRAVRETGARERFFVRKHNVVESTVDALTECKELSGVTVHSTFFDSLEPLLTVMIVLPSCSHVTSLRLVLWPNTFRCRVISLTAQCVTGMTALRKLELNIEENDDVDAELEDAFNKARRELVQALSAHKCIRKLIIEGLCFDETEIETLADALQSSRTLCELSFFPYDLGVVTSLVRALSTNISSNFTLLDVQLDRPWTLGVDWCTVADVIRRNCSLVTRAAHFVTGTRNRHCAAAVEALHWNPGLVKKVQELASVDEKEASSRIEKSLKSFSELDEFMRVAGVVKYGVTCQSRDDGEKQLVDVGRDCWLRIRQYINVGDILDEH